MKLLSKYRHRSIFKRHGAVCLV